MARLKNAPRRRRSPVLPEAAGGEDRLSSLPDALLRRVLSRLDTRTALSTAVLSRRWAHLPRDLPALRFSIEDVPIVTKFPGRSGRGTGYAALQKLGTKGVYCATTFLLDMGSSSKNIWDDVPGTTRRNEDRVPKPFGTMSQ
jgi:hypothetical protein